MKKYKISSKYSTIDASMILPFFLNIMQKLIFAKVNLNKKNSSCWKCTLWDFITFKGTLKIVTICTLNFRSMNMYHFLQSQDPIYGHGFIVWEQKGYILKSNYVPWFIWDIHAPTKRWASIKFQLIRFIMICKWDI